MVLYRKKGSYLCTLVPLFCLRCLARFTQNVES